MLQCEELQFENMLLNIGYKFPDINVGVMTYNNHKFLVQLVFIGNEDESTFFINTLNDIEAVSYMCIQYLFEETPPAGSQSQSNYGKITLMAPSEIYDDDIVFLRSFDNMASAECLNDINTYVEPLIQDKLPDLDQVYDFIFKIRCKALAALMISIVSQKQ